MSGYIQFAAGFLFLNPNSGNLATNPTPVQAFIIQDVSIDISATIKELRGASQYPDDTAVGDKKLSGKFGMGLKDLTMFNQTYSADTISSTGESVYPNFQASIPGTSPYTVTITPPASGTFLTDLGVYYNVNPAGVGNQDKIDFIKVASGPTVGQYTVSAGVYTFAAADEGQSISISYAYTVTGHGATYQTHNQSLGYSPQNEMWIVDQYQPLVVGGASLYNCIRIYAAKVNKITIGNKRVDYSIPEVDWEGFANSSGNVYDMYSVNG